MLSLRILLCALSTVTVMAFRQLEGDQALQQEVEFFDVPLTPSFRPESLISDDEQVPVLSPVPIPSALLDFGCCRTCKQYKTTGKLLGEGNGSYVFEVTEQEGSSWSWWPWSQKHFAWKSPWTQQGQDVLEHEAEVMRAAGQHNCSHVVPLIMSHPCVDGELKHHRSFVTSLLPYDLRNWTATSTQKKRLACYPRVAKAVYAGLECLHASGYIHGDLKADHILFEGYDEENCPSGIMLGDLGLARNIGSFMYKYDKSDYANSSHLVASLFDGQSDPLGLNHKVWPRGSESHVFVARVKEKIDYCSWAMLVTYVFGLEEDPALTEKLGKGSCGPMGLGRRKLYP